MASALPNVIFGAQRAAPAIAVFWEPGFPAVQDCGITQAALAGFNLLNEQELIANLNTDRFDLLITPYGSAFPKRAWKAIFGYLRAGGNWLNIGGIPLSRPVVRAAGGWRVESHQTTYHKQLGITAFVSGEDSFNLDLPG